MEPLFEPEQTLARKRPRQRRALDTVARIQHAMLELVVEEGYAAASTNRIAQRAGVNIGSVYQYYPNRLAIAHAIYEDASSRLARLMHDRILSNLSAPLRESVKALVDSIVDFVGRERAALLELVDQVPELRSNAGTLSLETLAYNVSRVYVEQHLGSLSERDVAHKLFFVQHLSMGLIRRYVQDHPPTLSRAEFVDGVADLIIVHLTGGSPPRARRGVSARRPSPHRSTTKPQNRR